MHKKQRVIKSDLKRIDALKEQDIDYSDNPKTDATFWREAKVVFPHEKVHLSVRFDRDLVEWFRQKGTRYQTRMNAILRTYMEATRKAS